LSQGPIECCVGPWIPIGQDWQFPLPPPPKRKADFTKVKKEIKAIMSTPRGEYPGVDLANGRNSHRSFFIYLAWQCGSTCKYTEHLGGCNGVMIYLLFKFFYSF
jgi:catalase (peroxidase I)